MNLTWTFNMDASKNTVLAAMPDDRETHQVVDWEKEFYGAKRGTLLDTQKVYWGRLKELANIEKLEVAEPIPLQEARAHNLEIVLRHRSTRTPARTSRRRHHQSRHPGSF